MSHGLIAITRQISPHFNECELTHLDRRPSISISLARSIISMKRPCANWAAGHLIAA